jgi:outer membrane autotransporter protein
MNVIAAEGQFFITNEGPIGSGAESNVVGWVFPVTSTNSSDLVEITDPHFTATIGSNFSAVPLNVTAAEGQFFITNRGPIGFSRNSATSDVVGWVFPVTSTSSSDLVEITSSTFTAGSAFSAEPNAVVAAQDRFFIVNNGPIGIPQRRMSSDVVGWIFPVTSTSSSDLVEITDPNFTVGSALSAMPSSVAAAEDQFFITNSGQIGGGGGSDIVGWVFPVTSTSSSDLVEITSSTFTAGSAFSASPDAVVATGGQFFIANRGPIGITSDVVGWIFPVTSTSSSDLVEITSSTFTVGSGISASADTVIATEGQFFITNRAHIGSTSDVVGWVFPATSTSSSALVEITDPNFTVGSTLSAVPLSVAAAEDQFFITNSGQIGGGGGSNIVGWVYSSTSPSPPPPPPPPPRSCPIVVSDSNCPNKLNTTGNTFLQYLNRSCAQGNLVAQGTLSLLRESCANLILLNTTGAFLPGIAQNEVLTFFAIFNWIGSTGSNNGGIMATFATAKNEKIATDEFVVARDFTARSKYCGCNQKKYRMWFNAVGDWIKESSAKNFTGFHSNTGGGLIGIDYDFNCRQMAGVAAGYVYSGIYFEHDAGRASSQQFPVIVYTRNLFADLVDISGSLLGSYVKNSRRKNVLDGEAISSPSAWGLVPHLGIGFVRQFNPEFTLEPFASLDWAVLWQRPWKEHGSFLNLQGKSSTGSVSRFEAGIQAMQTAIKGRWVFQETISYVNMTPFHLSQATVGLVGVPSFFTIASAFQKLNLLHVSGRISYQRQSVSIGINYIGEFGRSFSNQSINGNIGTDF